ncbi:hypothetical protein J2W34_000079 [Variovorax boronicumulans]|uniref:hypothetical protein n=1 Tax=Variovorax boronicumulans TaxID=436515 RepID=UPI002782C827|nr:hypothetical protein [Variovorax boronicumulans]MDQ0068305.1 hypothetical protein [Variovorax boronicumulans]
MSAPINDGGSAFPSPGVVLQNDSDCQQGAYAGMSLRDHFAGLAMQAHLITDTVPGDACEALLEAAERAGREPLDHLAFNAYEAADAMLKARAGS